MLRAQAAFGTRDEKQTSRTLLRVGIPMDTETQQLALVQTTGATPLAGPALVPFELLFAAQATALAMSRTSDGLLISLNPAWSALTGIAPEQAVGHTSV